MTLRKARKKPKDFMINSRRQKARLAECVADDIAHHCHGSGKCVDVRLVEQKIKDGIAHWEEQTHAQIPTLKGEHAQFVNQEDARRKDLKIEKNDLKDTKQTIQWRMLSYI